MALFKYVISTIIIFWTLELKEKFHQFCHLKPFEYIYFQTYSSIFVFLCGDIHFMWG